MFIAQAGGDGVGEGGFGIDVCTGGELAVALAGGIDPQKIEVHGNNKSVAEIDRAVSVGVKTIVMDAIHEIDRVATVARSHKKVTGLSLINILSFRRTYALRTHLSARHHTKKKIIRR